MQVVFKLTHSQIQQRQEKQIKNQKTIFASLLLSSVLSMVIVYTMISDKMSLQILGALMGVLMVCDVAVILVLKRQFDRQVLVEKMSVDDEKQIWLDWIRINGTKGQDQLEGHQGAWVKNVHDGSAILKTRHTHYYFDSGVCKMVENKRVF